MCPSRLKSAPSYFRRDSCARRAVISRRWKILRQVRLALLLFTAQPIIWAQNGDRDGEQQDAPPDHWVIPPAPALSVDDALGTFKLPPGFKIEIVAAEPLVFDPVAMQIGPDGRIWVAEMRGYMPNVDGTGEDEPVGTIAVLSDTDGDGRMDRRTEFASGLVLPRALALVGDGLLVGAPPSLWHYRDIDGDGVADERTEVSSRYGGRANPEHTANGLMWGADNWIYNANHDERLRYRSGQWQAAPDAKRGQWGITQDDVGRIYTNFNSTPLLVELFPGRYLLRNPDLPNSDAAVHLAVSSANAPIFPGRITPGVNRGYRMLDEHGYLHEVTAACGPLVFRGSNLPESVYGDVFFCEPAGNLVKRLVVAPSPQGSVTARNAYDNVDFLTSTDERFRPVNLANGPDGSLYVVDMYRGIIQHRIYVTTFLRRQIEDRGLERPIGMGRIYRVVKDDAPFAAAATPALHHADTPELVSALGHRDAWWRETAQRLLVEQADPTAIPLLQTIVAEKGHAGQLLAFWILEALDGIDTATWKTAFESDDLALRLAALQACESRLREDWGTFMPWIVAALEAPEPEVRRQAALTIAELPEGVAFPALSKLMARGEIITGLDEAIISGLPGRELALLEYLAAKATAQAAGPTIRLATATVIRRRHPAEVAGLFDLLGRLPADSFTAARIVAGIDFRNPAQIAKGVRISLPIEPTALAAYAARAPETAATRARELLEVIDGPVAQSHEVAVRPLTDAEQAQFQQGEALYALCAGCHQTNGQGMNGLAPALVGSMRVIGSAEVAAAIVLKGKEGAGLAMPPLESLDDDAIAAVLTYVRRAWGHTAAPVTVAEIAATRSLVNDRRQAWTDESLDQFFLNKP